MNRQGWVLISIGSKEYKFVGNKNNKQANE